MSQVFRIVIDKLSLSVDNHKGLSRPCGDCIVLERDALNAEGRAVAPFRMSLPQLYDLQYMIEQLVARERHNARIKP